MGQRASSLGRPSRVVGIAAARRRYACEPLERRLLLAAAELVRDIAVVTLPSDPESLTNVNGTIYFAADDGVSGRELWKSNGTSSGTVRVKDIYPGGTTDDEGRPFPNSSLPRNLTSVNGTLFFTATDAVSGAELWKSDGTSSGTVRVKDIRPGAAGSEPVRLTNVNGTLFFVADDGVSGHELWKSDGTSSGTVRVAQIAPGASSSFPDWLTDVNGTLYFSAEEFTNGANCGRRMGRQSVRCG
jgi:ELWxxDGT repeat protein